MLLHFLRCCGELHCLRGLLNFALTEAVGFCNS
jgi:hypothetical protein